MWNSIQVHFFERANNQHIVGKLQPFSLGTSKFSETYGIGKRTYQAMTCQNFRLIQAKISKLPQVEVQSTK